MRMRCVILVLVMTSAVSGATAGTVEWESRGQPEIEGSAVDIDSRGDVVVAAGSVGDEASNLQWFVRGIDRRSGVSLWEDRFGAMIFGVAKDVEIDGSRAFAAGWIFTPGLGFEFVVRAYDSHSGAVLWSQEIRRGDQCLEESPGFARCVAKTLTVRDERVYVAGHLTRTANRSDFAIVAFDASTGEQLWESVTDSTGTGALLDHAWAVTATASRVFVVGEVGSRSALLVQSHDAETGVIQWQQRVPGALNFTLKDTIATDGERLFVGGSDAQARLMVQAYDGATGALLWEDRADGAGVLGALTIDGDGEWIFATGVVGCSPETFLDCELAVRAYDANGLLWHREDVARGGDWYVTSIAAGGGRVVTGGNELLEDGLYHPTFRAYRGSDGTLESATMVDENDDPAPLSFTGFVNGVLVRNGGLLVGGAIYRSDGFADFIVRMYR